MPYHLNWRCPIDGKLLGLFIRSTYTCQSTFPPPFHPLKSIRLLLFILSLSICEGCVSKYVGCRSWYLWCASLVNRISVGRLLNTILYMVLGVLKYQFEYLLNLYLQLAHLIKRDDGCHKVVSRGW